MIQNIQRFAQYSAVVSIVTQQMNADCLSDMAKQVIIIIAIAGYGVISVNKF